MAPPPHSTMGVTVTLSTECVVGTVEEARDEGEQSAIFFQAFIQGFGDASLDENGDSN